MNPWRRRLCRNNDINLQLSHILLIILVTLIIVLILINSLPKNDDYNYDDRFERGKFRQANSKKKGKFAYVFYTTEKEYSCYVMVNVERLLRNITIGKNIDVVIIGTKSAGLHRFCTEDCFPQLRLITVPEVVSLTDNKYYSQSYVRFQAFRLEQYERVIVMDADGLVLRRMDRLFKFDLQGKQIGGINADYLQSQWLSSIFLIVVPSEGLYRRFARYLTIDHIGEVSAFANGSRYDMDVLNYVLGRGREARILPANFARLDGYFFDQDNDDEFLLETFYVHFSAKKPLDKKESLEWTRTGKFPTPAKGMKLMFTWFWDGFYRQCQPIVAQKQETVAMFAGDKGFYYPDPNEMAEYINRKLAPL